jgi:glyoxylase-like metal-dependent hydrolase (beta-lactamase superfamily II)
MIKILHAEVSPFMTNAYLVKDEDTSQAALVDPGDDPDILSRLIEGAEADVKYLIATHGHLDHMSAAAEMARRLNLGFMAHEEDRFLIESLPESCRRFGLPEAEVPEIARTLAHGDELPLGNTTLRFLHAPGHSPGSVLVCAGEADVIGGDVLFAGSIGRTDLPGGDMETLRHSVMEVLVPLGDEVRVHPGHGPSTTIGWERQNNMFLLDWSR